MGPNGKGEEAPEEVAGGDQSHQEAVRQRTDGRERGKAEEP